MPRVCLMSRTIQSFITVVSFALWNPFLVPWDPETMTSGCRRLNWHHFRSLSVLRRLVRIIFICNGQATTFFKGSVCHSLFLSPSSPCCQLCTLALDYLLLIYFKNPPSKFDSRATNSCRLVSAHPATPWIKIGPSLSPRLGFLNWLLNSGHDQIVESEL